MRTTSTYSHIRCPYHSKFTSSSHNNASPHIEPTLPHITTLTLSRFRSSPSHKQQQQQQEQSQDSTSPYLHQYHHHHHHLTAHKNWKHSRFIILHSSPARHGAERHGTARHGTVQSAGQAIKERQERQAGCIDQRSTDFQKKKKTTWEGRAEGCIV